MSITTTHSPSLTAVRGSRVGTSFPVDQAVVILGRDSSCQVVLASLDVSRKHARLVAFGDDYFLEDLGSTHGTLLNGQTLEGPALVKNNDEIQIGDCVLTFSDPHRFQVGVLSESSRIIRSRDASPTGEWELAGVRTEEKLKAILEICRDLIGPLDFDEVLDRILAALFRLFPKAERGFIVLEEGIEFVPRAVKLRDTAATHRTPSRTALAYVIQTAKAILSEDLQVDVRFDGSRSVADAGICTLMCVPLRDHTRRAIGAIQIDTSDPMTKFTTDDLDLLVAVAGQMGMAVDNARLHRTIHQSLQRQIEIQGFVDSMLAAAPIAVAFLDTEFRYVRVNHAMASLNGRSIDEHLGRGIGEIGGEVASLIEPIVRRVAQTGRPASGVEVVGRAARRPKSLGHWLCHCYPASGPDGVSLGFGIMLEDVAAARSAEEALKNSEQRYRLLFESNPQPMWVYDVKTLQFLAVNNSAILRYGYSLEEFLAMTIADIRPPEDVPLLEQRVASVDQTAHLNSLGWRHVTKGGAVFEVEISSHGITFTDRAARLVQAADVTLRIKAEAAVLAAKEAAEAANQAKDRFLAVLSHELRTPLTPVLLAVSVLMEDATIPTDHRETFEMIRRNIEIEAKLVDDLLDVARIERGNLRLDLEPLSIHAALLEAGEICQPEIDASGIRIEWDLRATQDHALADSGRIKQVFWNLIRNATKYTQSTGRLRIRTTNDSRVSQVHKTNRLIVEFADTGIGISPEDLCKIFEPFEQVKSTGRSRDSGLGLGLSISRAIIKSHGGTITAESPGKGLGTTFRVELSTVSEPVAVTNVPLVVIPPRALNVLVVEDNDDTRRYLELVLRQRGFTVVAARNLEAARSASSAQDFDLLISDIELPDGTGLELMDELVRVRPIRGIALSGFGSADDVAASLKAGFSEHLTKPINLDRLEIAIAATFDRDNGKRSDKL